MCFRTSILYVVLGMLFCASCSKPLAQFSYSGEEDPAPARIQFKNESKKAETYEWNFGDGKGSLDESPSHEYKSSGTYTVHLMAKKGKKSVTTTKELVIKVPKLCLIEIETDFGNMIVELYDETPGHRDNFIKLVEDGFYDGLLFHRVINQFMIQGGDPNSKNAKAGDMLGNGGPGYQIPGEFVDSLIHTKGALCAARTNNPEKKSSGSQFYIVHGKKFSDSELSLIEARKDIRYTKKERELYKTIGGAAQLDREYTVFGHVIRGLDVIDKIASTQTGNQDRPTRDVKMKMRAIR